MRATVRLPAYLQRFADGQAAVNVEFDATVRDALEALRALHPGVVARVLDESGAIRQHLNVFVGELNVRTSGSLDDRVPVAAEIMLLPSVSGG